MRPTTPGRMNVVLVLLAPAVVGHASSVATFVGSGTAASVDGTGAGASFKGTVYVARCNYGAAVLVRKVMVASEVSTTRADSTAAETIGGTGSVVRCIYPRGIVVSPDGTEYSVASPSRQLKEETIESVRTTLSATGTGLLFALLLPRG